MKREKKDEEASGGGNAFANLDKTTVLQEVRNFKWIYMNIIVSMYVMPKTSEVHWWFALISDG